MKRYGKTKYRAKDFHQKKELLELYNGLNKSHYTNEEDLKIVTLETAVDECIKEGILVDFLRKNRAEAIAVSIFEYDEEKEIRLIKEAERDVEKTENLKLMMKI